MYRKQVLFMILLLCGVFHSPSLVFSQTTTEALDDSIKQIIDNYSKGLSEIIPTEQEIISGSIADSLEVTTSPKNPNPHDFVSVSIQSYTTDLNKATITWFLNNNVVLSGVGEKSFKFKNGASGETTKVIISITTNTGVVATKELSWTPIGATIFLQANTYTPPFYKGKPLISPQSKITAIATPDSFGQKNTLSAGEYVYLWKKDNSLNQAASGYGKNVFSFVSPQPYRRTNVTVSISSVTENTEPSESHANITLSNPFVLLYEQNPLLGTIYSKPLTGTLSLSKKEFSMVAAPYFFSTETIGGEDILYNWKVNGEVVKNEDKAITLRNEKGATGNSSISLSVFSTKSTFQNALQNIFINFIEDSLERPLF